MNIILKINKLLLTIITLLFLTNSAYAAKNDCSVFKKFSKDFFACKAGNIKDGFKNTAGKLKPKSPTNDGTKSLEKAEAKKLKAAEKKAKALEKAEAKANATSSKEALKKAKALEAAEAKKQKKLKKNKLLQEQKLEKNIKLKLKLITKQKSPI